MLTVSLLVIHLAAGMPSDSVPLYDNLGSHHHAISSRVPKVQAYFNQGLRLAYGFNHDEAIRAFREAARRDPDCAICWWGVAYSYGPNINLPMDSAAGVAAYEAAVRARALIGKATPAEQAYIRAVSQRYGIIRTVSDRYGPNPATDRAKLDSAYARAMQALARQYPNDLDAATLAAEAALVLRPWDYWQKDGKPQPGTAELVASLERVLRVRPNHPGACHFYIHAVEATQPEKAVACAERLAALMPGAGHLVHMPAHIYILVGRWNDAIEANRHAVHADETYLAAEKPSGIYPLAYYPHNHHFLSFAATMAGQSALAIEHARQVRKNIPLDVASQIAVLQPLVAYPHLTLVTFGRWDDVLSEPALPANLRIGTALTAYAQGVAHAAKGHEPLARGLADTIRAIAKTVTEPPFSTGLNVALHALLGEISFRGGKLGEAEQHFRMAMNLEDQMLYTEPPDWYYPIRHSLGAVLLRAGRAADAEALYREDLKRFPENGWSLYGLAESLRAQGRHSDAGLVDTRLRKAWANADVQLKASRF